MHTKCTAKLLENHLKCFDCKTSFTSRKSRQPNLQRCKQKRYKKNQVAYRRQLVTSICICCLTETSEEFLLSFQWPCSDFWQLTQKSLNTLHFEFWILNRKFLNNARFDIPEMKDHLISCLKESAIVIKKITQKDLWNFTINFAIFVYKTLALYTFCIVCFGILVLFYYKMRIS